MATADEIAARYGFVAAFFNADPELAKLLNDAIRGNWTNERFQGVFMNTKWYRSRSASIRQWADLETRDPAELEAKVRERQLELYDQFSQMGIETSFGQTRSIAYQSLKFAWSDAQVRDVVASVMMERGGWTGGTAATMEMQVRQLAGDYGIQVTDDQVTGYVHGLINESYTEDNIRAYLKDMAKSKYTGMSSYLDQGMTVRDVAQPYISSYANLLEVGAETIDLNDSLVQQALQGAPAKPGEPPQMQSVYQFERALRRDPRWLRTKNARQSAVDAAMSIAKDWGLRT